MITSFIRIFKSGWISFWRNRWLSIAAMSVMCLTIFVITSLVMVSVMTNSLVKTLQDKIDVSVYFRLDAEEKDVLDAREALVDLSEVESVEYVSREEALARFEKRHEDNPVLMQSLDELDDNPLGASLNIKAQLASQYEAIVGFLSHDDFKDIIDKVNYRENQAVIMKVNSITNAIQKTGFIVSIILAAMAILVAFNTIRITMYSSREEINVMKLVGASKWFIRGPFLVEGALYGIIAGVVTLVAFYPILLYLSPKITTYLPGTDLLYFFQANFWGILMMQIGIGIALGMTSSLVAIRRYLKEQ